MGMTKRAAWGTGRWRETRTWTGMNTDGPQLCGPGVTGSKAYRGQTGNMQQGVAGPVAKDSIGLKGAAATWLQRLRVCRVARI